MKKKKWLIVLLAAALLASGIAAWQLMHPRSQPAAVRTYHTENVELTEANGVAIIHDYIPLDSVRRPGEIREIRWIIIHETDNRSAAADAKAHAQFLTGNTAELNGWHYTVDDHSIYHTIPDNEISWNAGDNRTVGGGNMNGIAIEMCVNLGNDYQKTLENTAALTAELMKTYDLTIDDVKLHRDFSGKICPHRLITENRVEEFTRMVETDYEALMLEESPAAN